jgi:diaminopimelate epimerase
VNAEELDALPLNELGPQIENSPLFPNRTNVSFWAPLSPGKIRARIFERGVGETLSSGTGACGAAIASVIHGGDAPVTVELDGGSLQVTVDDSLHVFLRGPGYCIYRGTAERQLNSN